MKRLFGIVFMFVIAMVIGQSLCFAQYVDTYPHKDYCPKTGKFLSGDYYAPSVPCYAESSAFCQCNCTAYVAWKINEQGLSFDNAFDDQAWGDANEWEAAAGRAGIGHDGTPLPGDIAFWNSGKYGHVAWVERVHFNSSGKPESVDVSEYNYKGDLKWSTPRNISVDSPSGYAHILLYKFGVMFYVDSLEMFAGGTWDAQPFSNQTSAEGLYLIGQLSNYRNVTLDGAEAAQALAYFGNPGMGNGSSTVSTPSSSTSKPELFVPSLALGDNGTKVNYYTDENLHLYAKVKNVGVSVSTSITKIPLKYYRFRGEKENGDTQVVGSSNITGAKLPRNGVKSEDISLAVPNEENKFQYYACINGSHVVNEANFNNDCSGKVAIHVHERPDLHVSDLVFPNNQTASFVEGDPDGVFSIVTLRNDGGEPFEDVPVYWYLDGVRLFYADDNMRHWNLQHNDVKHEDVTLSVPSALGMHTLTACAELSDDRDKNDNCKEIPFEVIPAPDQSLRADVNGDGNITSTDSLLVNRKALGMDMSQTAWVDTPITGDANCDGQTTTTDALLISRKAMGMSMVGTAWCLGN